MIAELIILKSTRLDLELKRKELALKKQEFDSLNEELLSKIEDLCEKMLVCEESIRSQALVEFKETGDKKLRGGVGIRVLKKLDYEASEALSWAKKHSLALSLDKRAFEKIAKADSIDFVKITEEPIATIPSIIQLEVKDE